MQKERTIGEMLYAAGPNGDKIVVSATGAVWVGDYSVAAGTKIKTIIVADGTAPLKVDCLNSDASTVSFYIPVPCVLAMDGISKLYFAGSDSTMITLVKE